MFYEIALHISNKFNNELLTEMCTDKVFGNLWYARKIEVIFMYYIFLFFFHA